MWNVNWLGFLAMAMSVIVFRLCYWKMLTQSVPTRILWMVILGIFSLPFALCSFYYLHVLPEWSGFYELRSIRGSEFLALFAGAFAGCLAALLPRFLLPALLLLLICFTAVPYVKPLLWPLKENEFHEKWIAGGCLQTTEATCGPASMATIFALFRPGISEKDVAKSAHTYIGGTEAWYLARFARAQGYQVKFDFRDHFSPDVTFPALVGVKVGRFGHFIAVLSISEKECVISDPIYGLEKIPLKDFQERYFFTGFHMSVSQ